MHISFGYFTLLQEEASPAKPLPLWGPPKLAAQALGCRNSYYWDSSLTADIGALAGLSLTSLCAGRHPPPSAAPSPGSQPLALIRILR